MARFLRPSVFLILLLPLFLTQPCLAEDLHAVKRVIDGDTLLLDNGERVRLIEVDTPEVHVSNKLYRDAERSQRDVATIQALGKKASAFIKKKAQGKKVRLEYDQANTHVDQRVRQGSPDQGYGAARTGEIA